MAIIGKGVLGGFSGALGSVQGAKQYGKDTIKERVRKPNNPRTAKQQATRDAMKLVQQYYKKLTYLTVGPVPVHLGKSEYLRARLLKLFLSILSQPALQRLPFSLMANSIDGDIFPVSQIIESSENVIMIETPQTYKAFNYSDTDRLLTLVCDPYEDNFYLNFTSPGSIKRSFGQFGQIITTPDNPDDKAIYAYQYCSADFTKFYTGSMFWFEWNSIL